MATLRSTSQERHTWDWRTPAQAMYRFPSSYHPIQARTEHLISFRLPIFWSGSQRLLTYQKIISQKTGPGLATRRLTLGKSRMSGPVWDTPWKISLVSDWKLIYANFCPELRNILFHGRLRYLITRFHYVNARFRSLKVRIQYSDPMYNYRV